MYSFIKMKMCFKRYVDTSNISLQDCSCYFVVTIVTFWQIKHFINYKHRALLSTCINRCFTFLIEIHELKFLLFTFFSQTKPKEAVVICQCCGFGV